MIEKLTAWICATPTRLGLTVLSLVTLLVGGGLAFGSDEPKPIAPATAPVAPPVTAEVAMETANAFVQSWCDLAGRTPEQWAADLQRRSTVELSRQWAPAMSSALSGDCPWLRSDVRWVSPTGALVAVLPKSTNTLLVTVVQQGGRLVVSDFGPEPATGDV